MLIGTYFLTTDSDKYMRLLTRFHCTALESERLGVSIEIEVRKKSGLEYTPNTLYHNYALWFATSFGREW